MRTLRHPPGDQRRAAGDEGAVLVIVAVIMVALLGIGALVLDLGALHVERRELQNGADAAALAIAQDCAGGDCGAAFDTAKQFADLNAAKDGLSAVDPPCGGGDSGLPPCDGPPPSGVSGARGWVRVTTSTQTPDDGDQVDFLLAPVMGALTGKTVHASAVAAWGAMGRATTIPLIMSLCEYENFGGVIPAGDESPILPTGPFTVFFHETEEATPCPAGGSGADAPGGFGWLDASSNCRAQVESGWVAASPGVAVPQACDPTGWRDETIVIAMFDETNDQTGSNLSYHVVGFVGIRLTGYSFPGKFWSAEGLKNAKYLCGYPNATCITGEFVEFKAHSGEFGGVDLGVTIVKMVG